MSIMRETEFPLVIVAMEDIIEIRLRDDPPTTKQISSKLGKAGKIADKKTTKK
jgi:hypothetical protein